MLTFVSMTVGEKCRGVAGRRLGIPQPLFAAYVNGTLPLNASRCFKAKCVLFFILKFGLKGTPLTINRSQMRPQNGGYMNNNIEKCKEDFPFRVISETPTGDGFVDCVWEMPVWVVEKLDK